MCISVCLRRYFFGNKFLKYYSIHDFSMLYGSIKTMDLLLYIFCLISLFIVFCCLFKVAVYVRIAEGITENNDPSSKRP